MRTNTALKMPHLASKPFTAEGAEAARISDIQQLRRSVLSYLLWEDNHYEDGQQIADCIRETAQRVPVSVLAALAVEARSKFHLRHVPLYLTALLCQRARGSSLVQDTLYEVIQRADELSEFLAIYAKVNGVSPDKIKPVLSNQVRKGLARAFGKFNDYALAKYDQANAVRLRDVLFLCHARPQDHAQRLLWQQLIDDSLKSPDTWEVNLSAGRDKRETFKRLLTEGKLGYLALLRNLRNMEQSGVSDTLVLAAIRARKGAERVLPFRYVAAAKAAVRYEDALDEAFLASFSEAPKLAGKTVAVIDVSGSMYASQVSAKSDMTRVDAACALAAILRETCEQPVIYATAGNDATRRHKTELVPPRRGLPLASAIFTLCRPLGGGGIFLKQAMDYIAEREKDVARVVVITDEQDCGIGAADSPLQAKTLGENNYLINVASHRNGIGYGQWTHLDGFSEHVIRWINEYEALEVEVQN